MKNVSERMLKNLELKGASAKTKEAYLRIIKKFSDYFMESPENLGTEEIKRYLLYLINEKKQASSTIQVAHAALTFLFKNTLEKSWEMDSIPRIKSEKKLPTVLSPREISAILDTTENTKHKALLSVIYSSGLRVSEAANLRISDIDSQRMQIRVVNSKGAKDRYTILSDAALVLLREYWKKYQPKYWLFPGRWKNKPITQKGVSHIFKTYKEKAGITKPATTHTLRHSFATHLLENGVDLHHIQLLLGHSSPEVTTIYLHVRRTDLQKIISPLDIINKKT